MTRSPRAKTAVAPLGLAWAWGGLAMGLALAALVPAALRAEGDVISAHGISTFGELKYPADFTHLDYVNPDAPKGGEFSQWAPGSFDSMNPYSIQGNAAALSSMLYESILAGTADEIGASYCLMCTTMEYPADRSAVTFHLRDDVKFSDGSPLTAEDVAFSYELFTTKGIPEFRAVFNGKVKSVTVVDPLTITFAFAEDAPLRDLPATVGGMPIFSKADYIAKNRDLESSGMEPFLGSGPYVLDKAAPGERLIYARNPDYWGAAHPLNVGQNNFDRIRVEYFADPTAAFEAFKAGVYTFRTENSSKQWATAYDFPNLAAGYVKKEEIANGNIASGQAFLFNLRREKFQDPRVRRAIGLMFNFEWSNETLFYGLYDRINSIFDNTDMAAKGQPDAGELAILEPLVAEGLFPPEVLTEEAVMAPVSNADSQLDRKALRAASALLDEAGWLVGEDGMRANASGEKLVVEFLESSPAFERILNPYVENLKALGVDARLSMVDDAQYSNRVDPPNFDFDMISASAVNGYEPGGEMKQGYGSETKDNSSRNRMGFADPGVDRLLDMIESAKTRAELDTVTRAFDRVMRRTYFWVPEWNKNVHTVAYYDQFGRPPEPPKYALAEMSTWWFDAEKAEKLKTAGVLK